MLDLEDSIDLIQGKASSLHIEEPYDWNERRVQHRKYNVKAPLDVLDA